ncbi:MAG: MoaD/ThiS family protein [Parerythrobacter sp.]
MAEALATIVFLGRLGELAGRETLTVATPLDWDGLLAAVGEPVATALCGPGMHVALDGEVLRDPPSLELDKAGEIALLPPVSGG